MKKTALITGITGQDGSFLAELLLDKGYDVHGIIRRTSVSNTSRIDPIKNKITLHDGDLGDSISLIRIIHKILPDEIYNLAAQSHVQVSFDVPEYSGDIDALGVLRILEAVRILGLEKKTKIYQASTSELFGKVEEIPQKETTPFHPYSPYAIAKVLTQEGIPSPGGKGVWAQSTVRSILCNEKYKGDALLQKVYTVDFLSKRKKVNEGEIPQYYVEGNHEAIISPAVFDQVQRQMQQRRQERKRQSCAGVFSGRIKCGSCGGWYGPKVWHSNDKYRKVVWRCNHKYDGGEKCATPHFDEETIKTLFVRALNIFCGERDEITAVFEEVKETAFRTNGLEEERDRLREEMNVVGELIQQRTAENAGVSRNQADYEERRDTLWERFDKAKARMGEVEDRIVANQAQGEMARKLVDTLKGMPDVVDSFDEGAWYALVDYVTVYGRDDVRFTFKNGVEIKV